MLGEPTGTWARAHSEKVTSGERFWHGFQIYSKRKSPTISKSIIDYRFIFLLLLDSSVYILLFDHTLQDLLEEVTQ